MPRAINSSSEVNLGNRKLEKRAEQARISVSRIMPDSSICEVEDVLAIEEPLEIRLGFYQNGVYKHRPISITMRTPGDDLELAAGFLFTEGIIDSINQIARIKHCGKPEQARNTVKVDVDPNTSVDLAKLQRNFYTTSSCGVCGKSSIEALATGAQPIDSTDTFAVSDSLVRSLPKKLLEVQSLFRSTGGLHAAGLFDKNGDLIAVREDVGRHNALDKIIGSQFLQNSAPLNDRILFLSGRSSFELVQKAVMAQIPIVAAVSAPSSLALEAAKDFGVTLLGFVREDKFNIYSNPQRINYEG